MYITGIGRTKFGVLKESIPELIYEAIYEALGDAKTSPKELDAIYVANFCAGPFQNQLHANSLVASLLPNINIPIIRIETACASGGTALYQALLSLKNFSQILVVGFEKMSNIKVKDASKFIAMAGDVILDQQEGIIFPAGYALIAQQHFLKYKTTTNDLALVSLKNHKNANLNKYAHFYSKKIDLRTIINSPVICEPLRLYDCSPISDGAAAVVISRNKKNNKSIKVLASTLATDTISLSQRKSLTSFRSTKIAAKKAYKMAKLNPKDINIAEVHDCFTIAEILAMEDLEFAKPGEAAKMIRNGETKINGKISINTDGGLKADGHPIGATGIAQVFEIITQLRSKAERRQVKNACIGLTHNVGGIGGTAVVHIFKKETV